jgi:hypothetical protein
MTDLGFESNLEQDPDFVPAKAVKSVKRSAPKKPDVKKRVAIILEDSDLIPPTGQFISCNGRAYMVQTGKRVEVPEEIISVLNDAITSHAITNSDGEVLGYRDRMRFPYRLVS